MHKRAHQDELFHKTFSFFFAEAQIANYEPPERRSENLHVDFCSRTVFALEAHVK